MADSTDAGVFRRSTTTRISSAEELDHYIRVANPSAWVVLAAALLLVGSIAIWATTAIVPITMELTGFTEDGTNVYIMADKDTAEKLKSPDVKVRFGNTDGHVVNVADLPVSASEVADFLGNEFYSSTTDINDWNYVVVLEANTPLEVSDFALETQLYKLHLVQVSITVKETQPINIIFERE